MGAICLTKLIDQMDGFFGCNVSIEESKDGEQEFSFKKKTLFDLIKNVFSSSDSVKTDREATVQALKAVSTHLDPKFKSKLDTLVEGYESSKENIDFKEVRKVLRSSLPPNSIKFPPVVYSKDASDSGNLLGLTKLQSLKTPEKSNVVKIKSIASAPVKYQSAREEEFERFNATWTFVSTADTDAAEHEKYRKQQSEQEFAKIRSEIFQLSSEYQKAPLNTLNISRW